MYYRNCTALCFFIYCWWNTFAVTFTRYASHILIRHAPHQCMATFHNSLNGDVQPYFMHWLDLILAIVTTSVKLASKITHFPSYYVIILVPNYLVKKSMIYLGRFWLAKAFLYWYRVSKLLHAWSYNVMSCTKFCNRYHRKQVEPVHCEILWTQIYKSPSRYVISSSTLFFSWLIKFCTGYFLKTNGK